MRRGVEITIFIPRLILEGFCDGLYMQYVDAVYSVEDIADEL